MTKTLQYFTIGGAVWSASVFVLGLWITNIISKDMHQVKTELSEQNTKVLKEAIEEMRKENQSSQSLTLLVSYIKEAREEDQQAMLEFYENVRRQNKKFESLIKYKEAKFDTVHFEDSNGKMWLMVRGDYFGKPIYKQIPFKE